MLSFESTNLISSNAPAPSSPPLLILSPRLTHPVMAHRYSLRPNSKGRRMHQSTDETKDRVKSTSTRTRTSTSTDKLEGESGVVDPRPATPDTPRARVPHSPPWHSLINVTSSAPTTSRYHIDGPPEAIQVARKREEARSIAQAVRIRREQIVRGYEEDLRSLRARIVVLRRECEVKVERARQKSERKWAFERGEVAVVVDDDKDREGGNLVGLNAESDREDAHGGEMAVDKHYAQMERTSLTTKNDDDKQQSRWSSRSSQFTPNWSHRSESDFPPPPPLRKTQQQEHLSQRQQQEVDERGPAGETHTVSHTGRRLLRENHTSQGQTSSHGRPRPHHPQPLRRQRTQLMANPSSSHSRGLHTYGTAVLDHETENRFGGTDGDNDSEMGG